VEAAEVVAVAAVPRAPAVVVEEEAVVVEEAAEAVEEVAVPQRRLHRQSGPRRN
jgi:hypothetical protein